VRQPEPLPSILSATLAVALGGDWNCKPKRYQAGKSCPIRSFTTTEFSCSSCFISLAFGGISSAAPVYSYKVIARYPHSSDSYTEGFFYLNGMFYEGTGRTGRSAVLVIEPKTGRIVQRRDLAPEYFGEGIVDWGRIFMSGRGHRTFVSSTTA